jgi:hypothetical protein
MAGVRLNLQTNADAVARRIAELGNQLPYAMATALSRTATLDVRPAIRAEMGRVFDRPTDYTLNSMFVKGANKSNLEARVWLKDNPFSKGTPADRYLAPQIFGGSRYQKGMERALQAARLMLPNQYAVPAAGAQLDANGNVKRSQIVQILSQLRAQTNAGYESRRSNSAASRRSVARQGQTYFALPRPSRGLHPGIYLKRQFAHGTAIRPVFLFVNQVSYRPRLRFFEVGEAAARAAFPGRFDEAAQEAISRAGL